MACDKPGVVTLALILGLLVIVPCMLLLIPPLGITGAALALLLSTVTRLAFVLYCFPLVLKIPFSSLWAKKQGWGLLWT
jgi:O-antigen/teichoic acid export membrane protein